MSSCNRNYVVYKTAYQGYIIYNKGYACACWNLMRVPFRGGKMGANKPHCLTCTCIGHIIMWLASSIIKLYFSFAQGNVLRQCASQFNISVGCSNPTCCIVSRATLQTGLQ